MPLLGSRGAASLTGFGGLAKLGYLLRNSLRFRSSASAYLSKNAYPTSSGTKYTFSLWLKFGTLASVGFPDLLCFVNTSASRQAGIGFSNAGTGALTWWEYTGSYTIQKITSQLFRDPAAWYHIVCAWDSANATADDRAIIYVNGVRVTSFSTNTNPAQNTVTQFSNGTLYPYLGAQNRNNSSVQAPFDGYMTEINFIDGQALTPSSFGKTDPVTGQWIPIKYGSTYGTNGFYLNFTDASAATAAAIGKDSSGNGNNWTPNNFSITAGATYDSMTDVPTLTSATAANYCTWNPLNGGTTGSSLTNGNLQLNGGTGWASYSATMAFPATGNYYCEITGISVAGASQGTSVGILNPEYNLISYSDAIGNQPKGYGWYSYGGATYNNGSGTTYNGGATYTTGTVIGIQVNNGVLTFYKNGVSQGTAYSGITGSYVFAASCYGTDKVAINCGQQPFVYSLPSGAVALNTYNI